MDLKEKIRELFPNVRRPSRYLGNEVNVIRKDLTKVDLKVCLCYPDTYEIGMSNIGLSILYHLLNDRPRNMKIACERVFAPWIDMEEQLRSKGLPLSSLESALPLRGFDVLGISLPYELTYTNILTILDLAKIPFYSRDRLVSDTDYPLVIGGGTGAFNPEPVADFFDAIVIGDGEEAILEICNVVKKYKQVAGEDIVSGPAKLARFPEQTLLAQTGPRTCDNTPPGYLKTRLLKDLSQIRGVYIPSFFRIDYHTDGTVREIKSLVDGYTGVRKRTVSNLDTAYYPTKPIVPHTKVVHDRIGVEVQRGCTRGCRFCQAGYIYRPERQRSPETVKKIVRNQIAATGQEEVSLVSLSIGDYDCLMPLLKDLMDEHSSKRVGISLPATRVEQLTPAIMEEIKRVRKTGFTIAPEAATERMRNVINKGNSEENLLTTVRAVFSNGWSLMKFYFMIGLPTEMDEDVVAIASLGQKTLKIGLQHNHKAEINLGVSPFVPKPFTPYQWCGQIPLNECHRRLDLIRSEITSRRLHLKPHRPETSYLEGIFSRGDRRLSALIIKAWEKGCRFDEWDEALKFELWKEAWTELGIDPTFYVERERKKEEVLPWDHLFVEMDKEWLWEEWEASLKNEYIDDCSTGKCTICGVCDYKEVRNRAYELPVFQDGKPVKKRTTTEIQLYGLDQEAGGILSSEPARTPPASWSYHCTFSKTGPATFLSHLEFVDALRRAVARAGLPVRYSQGFHPLPRISFGPAMPVGKEMLDQEFKIELEATVNTEEIKTRLNRELPEGLVIREIWKVNDAPRVPASSFSPLEEQRQ